MYSFEEKRAAKKGHLFGKIKSGQNTFDFLHGKGGFYTFLNGTPIIENTSKNAFLSETCPVVSMMMNPGEVLLKKGETYTDMMQGFIDNMSGTDGVKMVVLELTPDELVNNSPAESKRTAGMHQNLINYQNDLKAYSEDLSTANHLSSILLKTNFPKSMWGAKDIKNALKSIQNGKERLAKDFEGLEVAAERSDNRIRHATTIMEKNAGSSIIKTAAVDVANDFFLIKGLLSKTAGALFGLYDIDKVFKKYAGYPTTWFFNSSLFYDFQYSYENLVKNIMKSAKNEAEAVEPFFQFMG